MLWAPMQVEKIDYFVKWELFTKGSSIFVPCLSPSTARAEVLCTTDMLGLKVIMKSVIHDGVRGLRIWRA